MSIKTAAFVNVLESSFDTFKKLSEGTGIESSYYLGKPLSEIIDQIMSIEILFITVEKVTEEHIKKLPNLKVIARLGIGLDNIDIPAATRANVAVIYTPDYCIEEVALHACSMILAGNRKLFEANALARENQWNWAGLKPIYALSSLTLGLIGIGNIGEKVISMMRGFECKMMAYDPYKSQEAYPDGVQKVTFEEVLQGSDIITLHLPLTTESKYIINKDIFKYLKKKPLFINVSRGALIKSDDMVEALDRGIVSYLMSDVAEKEPPDKDDALVNHSKSYFTTHMAWYSENSSQKVDYLISTRVLDYLAGKEVPTLVNKEVLLKK